MHSNRLADDKAIADQFSDRLAGVGIGDFVDFVRVEPDLALAASHDRGSQTLLRAKVDPVVRPLLARFPSMAGEESKTSCASKPGERQLPG